jgi:Fur family ferric uptake transcriptional regulator
VKKVAEDIAPLSIDDETQLAKDVFMEFLAKRELRQTEERYKVLDVICSEVKHVDVDQILETLQAQKFPVSRASIYNTLDLLVEAHLVVRHEFHAQSAQYELRSRAANHHHLICKYCGSITEAKKEKINVAIRGPIPKFTYEFHTLYIYGMCSKCKFRRSKQYMVNNK